MLTDAAFAFFAAELRIMPGWRKSTGDMFSLSKARECRNLAAVIFTQFDVSESGRDAGKLILLAIVGGEAAGNFLWARFAGKREADLSDE
jgi:hypothetical protein